MLVCVTALDRDQANNCLCEQGRCQDFSRVGQRVYFLSLGGSDTNSCVQKRKHWGARGSIDPLTPGRRPLFVHIIMYMIRPVARAGRVPDIQLCKGWRWVDHTSRWRQSFGSQPGPVWAFVRCCVELHVLIAQIVKAFYDSVQRNLAPSICLSLNNNSLKCLAFGFCFVAN